MTAEVVVVDAVRTPFARRGGSLAGLHPADLLGSVLQAILVRTGLDPARVDQVVAGCVEKTGEQGFNIARTAWLAAGLPTSTGATTVDTQCGSSQEAFTLAHALVASGLADVVVACGVESMSRVPMGTTFTAGPGNPIPPSFEARYAFPDQFASAEAIARHWSITRADCDELAFNSNNRALAAWERHAFDDQLVPIGEASRDECIRAGTLAALAALEPVGGGVHTAASTSKIADAASAVLLMTRERADAEGLVAKAVVTDSVLVGVEPEFMLTGPITATKRLLERNDLTIGDVDIIEVNEAFASVVLAWAIELKADLGVVNRNGGAMAMGHPLGASGTALITKAVHDLAASGAQTALVTMCCGGALGTGTLLTRA